MKLLQAIVALTRAQIDIWRIRWKCRATFLDRLAVVLLLAIGAGLILRSAISPALAAWLNAP